MSVPSRCKGDGLDKSQLALERVKNELKWRAHAARQQTQSLEPIEAKQPPPIPSRQKADHPTFAGDHVPKGIREELAELVQKLSNTTDLEELSTMAWVAGRLLERAENLSKRNHGALIQSRFHASELQSLSGSINPTSTQRRIRTGSAQYLSDYTMPASAQGRSPAGVLKPPTEDISRASPHLRSQPGSLQTSPRSTIPGSVFTASTSETDATDFSSPSSLPERGSGITKVLMQHDTSSFQLPEPANPLTFSNASIV